MENKFFETATFDSHSKSNRIHFAFSANEFYDKTDSPSNEDSQYEMLRTAYEDLIAMHNLTERQSIVFEELIKSLVYDSECPSSILSKVEFSFSQEEGIIMHRRSNQGISFIAIDEDGDSMFSFSSYQSREKGKRMFFNYGSGSEEAMAYRLLAD